MKPQYVSLHTHTEYSMLDGLSDPKELVQAAVNNGMNALATTDHGNMYGAIEFYHAAKNAGINPIVGCELYGANRRMQDHEKEDRSIYHLIALSKDITGYRNLMKLVTIGNTEGFYYKPRVDHDALSAHSEGLIILSGCASSELSEALRAEDTEKANKTVEFFLDTFGRENYYIELQDHGITLDDGVTQAELNKRLIQIAKKYDVKLVCTNDSHYTCKGDHDTHDLLLCIQTASNIDDPKRFKFHGSDHYLKSAEEMAVLFPEHPDALYNTVEIAEKCNLDIPFGRINFPKLPFISDGKSPDEFLEELCWRGIYRQYQSVTEVEANRLKYELEVIKTTGYAPYILFVWDFVREARERDILCGPRGSAAGSIVLYCLDITTLDPIANGLTFERFLNPERIQMPDIDMDFADSRREEIIEYITNLYGRDHVSQIVTIGRMMARAAIKDTGRALNYPIFDVERISRMIPTIPVGMTIDKSLAAVSELRQAYDTDPDIKILIDRAKSIEGTVRQAGVHAAGIVVSGDPLIDHTPLQNGSRSDSTIVTQYEMHALEDIGLLKMDFLGLANLSLLENALKIIEQQRGIKINLRDIKDGDKKTYAMLGSGDSTGVFQLEGAGMRRVLRQFKPESIGHLAAIVALYRPGPMDHIPQYIDAKNGNSQPEYLHPSLEPILSDTYGVYVYQDQILQIVQAIAGYSLGHADIVRRAMGKKIKEEMQRERQSFLDGAVNNGVNLKVAEGIWEQIEPHAGYSFNRAHATCYGQIAYQTAYLKCNYPKEYMTAMLTTQMSNTDKVVAAVGECHRLGIKILTPDINKSEVGFTIEPDGIRFGLGAIKQIGEDSAHIIVNDRNKNGEYKSLDSVCRRMPLKIINKRVIEMMAKAGALDMLGKRESIIAAADRFLKVGRKNQIQEDAGQMNMLGLLGSTEDSFGVIPDVADATDEEKSAWEKESLGFFLSNHPFERAALELEDIITMNTSQIPEGQEGEKIVIAGVLASVKNITTKKGDAMAIMSLEDLHGSIEIISFPAAYKNHSKLCVEDLIVIVEGRISLKGDKPQIIVNTLKRWEPDKVYGTAKEEDRDVLRLDTTSIVNMIRGNR